MNWKIAFKYARVKVFTYETYSYSSETAASVNYGEKTAAVALKAIQVKQ